MRIDPERLIRLAVLIQHGSFKRAAEQLCVTQPALSQSIAQIEKEIGAKLIERTSHGVEPTIYGHVLYEHAKAIDRELAHAARRIQELTFGHKNGLSIGATSGGAATLVSLALCRILGSYPAINIRVVEELSVNALLAQLHDRSLDIVICQKPVKLEPSSTRAIPLIQVSRVACVRSGHPLSGDVSLKDLSTYPFVCPEEEMGSLFGFTQIFSTVGLKLPELLLSNSIHVAKEIVLNSDAFALFSDISVLTEKKEGGLRTIQLETPTQYWMNLLIRSEQAGTAVICNFVREILSVCRHLDIAVHPDAVDFQRLAPDSFTPRPPRLK
jgi:DNA-binding transcriptional LysR family regulator